MAQTGLRASLMRGGTSKGLYFLAEDLPTDRETRDRVLLAAMGSPDGRQIDGLGGGHPLTSKVAVVRRSERPDCDVDYLFLQVWPDRAEVSTDQNCGNILAGVAPFAIVEGLVPAESGSTSVAIWMENTRSRAVAHVVHDGDVAIDFLDIAGSTCGSLLPTGRPADRINGLEVTCVDNGMPVVCVRAGDLGVSGYESPAELEGNPRLCRRIEELRLAAGVLMNLGDVTDRTVPKVTLVAPPRDGGAICTRSFIPHRVHDAIGVLGAISVATACLLPGSVVAELHGACATSETVRLEVEHPGGHLVVELGVELDGASHDTFVVRRAALLRTARLLMRGEAFIPSSIWEGR